jgi:hypothetical protein
VYAKQITVHRWTEGADEPSECQVILRKWSALKLITLFGDIGEIGAVLTGELDLKKIADGNQGEILRLVNALGTKAVQRLANLVSESILKPSMTVDEILQWDLDDLVSAVAEVVRMNCGEGTRKNFLGLRDALKDAIEGGAGAARAKTNSVPAASRSVA